MGMTGVSRVVLEVPLSRVQGLNSIEKKIIMKIIMKIITKVQFDFLL